MTDSPKGPRPSSRTWLATLRVLDKAAEDGWGRSTRLAFLLLVAAVAMLLVGGIGASWYSSFIHLLGGG